MGPMLEQPVIDEGTAPMTRSEKLSVVLIAVPPALLSLVVLLIIAAFSIGEAIGSLFEAIGGENLTRSWWVHGSGFGLLAGLTVVAQLLATRALARGMAEPPRKRAFGRFGVLAGVLILLLPALIGNLPQMFQ